MTKRSVRAASSIKQTSGMSVISDYLLTLTLFAVAALFPGLRTWGFNVGAYLSPLVVGVLIIGAGSAAIWAVKVKGSEPAQSGVEKNPGLQLRTFWYWSIPIVLLWSAVFLLLRAETHFLGDGYALLANLAKLNPFVKPTESGTEFVLHAVKSLFGKDSATTALWAYQAVSIGAGVAYLVMSAFFALAVMEKLRDRLLCFVALSSGGQMLLFFGYVENYALLSLSVALFVMTGVLAARGKLNRHLIIVPLVMAASFHVVGLVLVPAALYAVFHETPLSDWPRRWSFGRKVLILSLLAVSAVLVLRSSDFVRLYLRLAFVPLLSEKFTPAGYTLFSAKHLLDMLNLLFLLVPGVLVAVVFVFSRTTRQLWDKPDYKFLIVAALSVTGAAFFLDPKLGMARDWDLFAFAGIPVTILACLLMLSGSNRTKVQIVGVVLFISLGLTSLFARATVQHDSASGARLAQDYMTMDLARNRWGFSVLQNYYQDRGDSARVSEIKTYRKDKYPETAVVAQARILADNNQLAEAKQMVEWAISRDHSFAEAWAGLCVCYYRMGMYDSALVAGRIADGLNPNNPAVVYNMGLAMYQLSQVDQAETLWLRSAKVNPDLAALSLAHLYRDRDDTANYYKFLIVASALPSTGPSDLKEAARALVRSGRFAEASALLGRLLAQGKDSAFVREMVEKYPGLTGEH